MAFQLLKGLKKPYREYGGTTDKAVVQPKGISATGYASKVDKPKVDYSTTGTAKTDTGPKARPVKAVSATKPSGAKVKAVKTPKATAITTSSPPKARPAGKITVSARSGRDARAALQAAKAKERMEKAARKD